MSLATDFTGDIAEVKLDCAICQDKFTEDKIETRECGHTTCQDCDSEWRIRGTIVAVNVEYRTAQNAKRQTKKFHIPSTCPLCRAVETCENYKSRSKKSLADELSIVLGMLYRRNIFKLERIPITAFQEPRQQSRVQHRIVRAIETEFTALLRPPVPPVAQNPYQGMDDLTRQTIEQLIAQGDIMHPTVRASVITTPVVTPPVAPIVTPPVAPIITREVVDNYGLVTRPRAAPTSMCVNRRNGCYTNKTKMKCPRCNIALCRDCKNRCPTCN